MTAGLGCRENNAWAVKIKNHTTWIVAWCLSVGQRKVPWFLKWIVETSRETNRSKKSCTPQRVISHTSTKTGSILVRLSRQCHSLQRCFWPTATRHIYDKRYGKNNTCLFHSQCNPVCRTCLSSLLRIFHPINRENKPRHTFYFFIHYHWRQSPLT